jgi:dihydroorotate dehydrogenase (NAD+) catalytic subunit
MSSTSEFRKVRVFRSTEIGNSEIYRLNLHLDKFDPQSVRAGQFIALRPENDADFIRPYSIAWTDRDGILLYVKTVGDENSNSRLFAHAEEKVLEFSGPHGQPFELITGIDNYILVAGGSGVAGLLPLAKMIKDAGKQVTFIVGAKSEDEVIGQELLADLKIVPQIIIGTKKGEQATDLLEKSLAGKNPKTAVIACGPRGMLKKSYDLAQKKEVPCLVSVELVMACATHSCKGCAIEMTDGSFKHVCHDGPIFAAAEIAWGKFIIPPAAEIVPRSTRKQLPDPLKTILYGKEGRYLILDSVCFNGSGSLGEEEAVEMLDKDVAAYTTKGVSAKGKKGNPYPRICEVPGGAINSIGLENVGIKRFIKEKLPIWLSLGKPLFINICGDTRDEFEYLIRELEAQKLPDTVAYELNLGCPNVDKGGMLFGVDPHAVYDITVSARHRAPGRFITVKLTPNVTDIVIEAHAAERGGADCLTLCNTLVAMDIDIETRRPKLGRVMGGLSGHCVLPVILPKVLQVYRAGLGLPIIASGGVTCGEDALKYLINGANAVMIATALFVNKRVCGECNFVTRKYLMRHNIPHSQDLVGTLMPAA